MLAELKIHCPFKVEGCLWVGNREDWAKHALTCQTGEQGLWAIHERRDAAKGVSLPPNAWIPPVLEWVSRLIETSPANIPALT